MYQMAVSGGLQGDSVSYLGRVCVVLCMCLIVFNFAQCILCGIESGSGFPRVFFAVKES